MQTDRRDHDIERAKTPALLEWLRRLNRDRKARKDEQKQAMASDIAAELNRRNDRDSLYN